MCWVVRGRIFHELEVVVRNALFGTVLDLRGTKNLDVLLVYRRRK